MLNINKREIEVSIPVKKMEITVSSTLAQILSALDMAFGDQVCGPESYTLPLKGEKNRQVIVQMNSDDEFSTIDCVWSEDS